jgi:hypothetical protein
MDDFFSLSRYAPDDVDTDVKRRDKFLAGLKGELKIPLSVAYTPNYQALLDQAVTLDNNSGRKRTARGNSAMARTTLSPSTRSTTLLRAVGMEVHTGMEATSAKAMVAISMATGTMEDSGETTPMVTAVGTMDTITEEMVSTVPTQMPRRISPTSHATSVRSLDTTPTLAQRASQRKLPSLIRSRRDM